MSIPFFIWAAPLLGAMVVLLALSFNKNLWRWRIMLGDMTAGLLIAGSPFVLMSGLSGWLVCALLALYCWLLLLALRVAFGRLGIEFLRTSTRFNNIAASSTLVIITLTWWAAVSFVGVVPLSAVIIALLLPSLAVAVAFTAQLLWALSHYRAPKDDTPISFAELPTVTLAIPARNETHALTDCLTAALTADYPKLEILVVDDCSYDKTSQIIRSFAHEGIRFIQGEVPAEGWLGKNQACQLLAEQATGQYIVFAGVDTHIGPQSISKLIAYMVRQDMKMVSVLPTQRLGVTLSTLLLSLRYYWQVALPISTRRVPVASQLWCIQANALRKLGGFAAVKNKIVPEGSFARRLFAENAYRFVLANSHLDITTAKRLSSQYETALRFLYPTFKRQPGLVLAGVNALILLIVPFGLLVWHIVTGNFGISWWMNAIAVLLLVKSYALLLIIISPRSWLWTALCMPIALIQEAILLIVSMLQYEFGEVNWKGRNVCYPVIESAVKSLDIGGN